MKSLVLVNILKEEIKNKIKMVLVSSLSFLTFFYPPKCLAAVPPATSAHQMFAHYRFPSLLRLLVSADNHMISVFLLFL